MNPHDAEMYEMTKIETANLQDEMQPLEESDEEEVTRFYEHFRF